MRLTLSSFFHHPLLFSLSHSFSLPPSPPSLPLSILLSESVLMSAPASAPASAPTLDLEEVVACLKLSIQSIDASITTTGPDSAHHDPSVAVRAMSPLPLAHFQMQPPHFSANALQVLAMSQEAADVQRLCLWAHALNIFCQQS
jgi:hypothetical protein